jgi:hypothetical protein
VQPSVKSVKDENAAASTIQAQILNLRKRVSGRHDLSTSLFNSSRNDLYINGASIQAISKGITHSYAFIASASRSIVFACYKRFCV